MDGARWVCVSAAEPERRGTRIPRPGNESRHSATASKGNSMRDLRGVILTHALRLPRPPLHEPSAFVLCPPVLVFSSSVIPHPTLRAYAMCQWIKRFANNELAGQPRGHLSGALGFPSRAFAANLMDACVAFKASRNSRPLFPPQSSVDKLWWWPRLSIANGLSSSRSWLLDEPGL